MKKITPLWVDSHCHLDSIDEKELRKDVYYVSWSFAGDRRTYREIITNLKEHAERIKYLKAKGFNCGWLAGIHPRSISDDFELSAVPEILLPFLGDKNCLGIGEIGVEGDSIVERNLFLAQMSLCSEVRKKGKVIGVHTPRAKKKEMILLTESLLSGFSAYKDMILIDHLDAGDIDLFINKGFYAGITINSNKISACEFMKKVDILDKTGKRQLLVGSDSYKVACMDYVKTADQLHNKPYFCSNALEFFNIN